MPHSTPQAPLRRRVRVQHRTGDEVTFVTKSFSRDDGTQYHPVINEATGEFSCDCPDHRYRQSFCKHLRRAQAQLKRAAAPNAPVVSPTFTSLVAPPPLAPVASPTYTSPVVSPPLALAPVVSPPLAHRSTPLLKSGLRPLSSASSLAMPRFFANEHIAQIIPAPSHLKAQFADGCADEPVLCLTLLSVPAGSGGKAKEPYQLVMPMVAYHGAIELACDIERPYLRLSSETR